MTDIMLLQFAGVRFSVLFRKTTNYKIYFTI